MAGASVNKVILIGNLGKDPEVRFTQGGSPVANFSLATNEVWNDKGGQKQEKTEWHRIVVWGKQAEHCGQYLSKGRPAYIEGRLQTREWTDKEGKKQYTTEVVAQVVKFLSDGRGAGGAGGAGGSRGGSSGGPDDFGPPPPGFDEGGSGGGGGGGGSRGGGGGGPGPGEDDIPF